jgi:aminocarboxymuconate-semialdehyde decarboxylase
VIIDLHSHFLPLSAGFVESASVGIIPLDNGSAVFADAAGHRTELTAGLIEPQRQLEAMARQGVDVKTLAVPPFCFQYELDIAPAKVWSRALNEGIAETAASSEGRFIGFATVPLQQVDAAVEELEYAVSLGMRGVEIATNINGVELDDPQLDPFWARCASLGMPVLIHPHYVAGVGRMKEYHLRNLIGNPLETALAGARLIFGGVLRRYPDLKVILSHGGGALPGLIGRLEHGRNVRPELRETASFEAALKQLYFDSIVFDSRSLDMVAGTAGADRIVLGTDYPFDMSDDDPVAFIRSSNLEEDQKERILTSGADLFGPVAS